MILSSLSLPASVSCVDTECYLRHVNCAVHDNIVELLVPGACFSTDTFHNFIAIEKYKSLTNFRDYQIKIKGQGEVVVDTIGILRTSYYDAEVVLDSRKCSLTDEVTFNVPESDCSSIYLRITALTRAQIEAINFCAEVPEANCIKLAYCICSYNRENFVKEFLQNISLFHNNSEIDFFIVENGQSYQLGKLPANVKEIKNRNLGGAGGFTRGIVEALENGEYSHIILADDDISISTETFNRLIALLKGLKKEYSSHFISGAMLSRDERWLQYERTAILTPRGFVSFGNGADLRVKHVALNEALQFPRHESGLAGWWFCVFPVRFINEFGLPLPVFIRGDDVEYSVRCHPKIITWNGLCVWHEPFIKKYNEVMEDYYLVRNLTLISFIYDDTYRQIRTQFVFRKFIRNILLFDYVGAYFNVLALRHIKYRSYLKDPERLNIELFKDLKTKLAKNIPTYKSTNEGLIHSNYSNKKAVLKLFLQYSFGVCFGEARTLGGFARNIKTFLGRSQVSTYQEQGIFRVYKFKYFEAWKLIFQFLKIYVDLKINSVKYKKEIKEFAVNASKKEKWLEKFNLEISNDVMK